MRITFFLRTIVLGKAGLLSLAVIISLVAGISLKFSASPFSPLMVCVAIFAALIGITLLRNPILALYTAIFVFFTPSEIIKLIPVTFFANYAPILAQFLACISFLLCMFFHHRRVIWPGTNTLLLVFITWSFITLFWAQKFEPGFQQIFSHLVGFSLLLLVVNQINTIKTFNGLMSTLALINWMLLLSGIGTVLTEGYSAGVRLNVLGLNENSFGPLILVSMTGVLWQVMHLKGRKKVLSVLLVPLYYFGVISMVAMSGSRGSAISILITFLSFIFWKPTRPWGILGLVVLTLTVISVPLIFSTTLERFAATAENTLLGGREAIWRVTWWLIRDHPWLGVGIGNAPYSVPLSLRLFRSIGGAESASIHNPILSIWAETGLPGIILYLGTLAGAMLSFLRQSYRNMKSGSQYLKFYFPIVSAVFLGYMTSWIKSGGMESSYTYYLILALLLIPSVLDTRVINQ